MENVSEVNACQKRNLSPPDGGTGFQRDRGFRRTRGFHQAGNNLRATIGAKFTVEIHPHIEPSRLRCNRCRAFAWSVKTRLSCGSDILAAKVSVNLAASSRDEPETEFSEHPPFFPFELVRGKGRLGRGYASCGRTCSPHPACVRYIKRFLKETVIEGRVCAWSAVIRRILMATVKHRSPYSTGFSGWFWH